MANGPFSEEFLRRLGDLKRNGCLRALIHREPSEGGRIFCDGRTLVSFGSNDYLGLSNHSEIAKTVASYCASHGFGSTGSRLLSGSRDSFDLCEQELAEWLGYESCLLFNSGYQANIGAISTLVGPGDSVVFDREVHASVIDGIRLSKAEILVYPSCNSERARELVFRATKGNGKVLLITESVFSMSGAIAPLKRLRDIATEFNALFYVDEAHSIGVIGSEGSGLCNQVGVKADVLIGTAGKALGTSGAFVLGDVWLRDTLINFARSFIFSTASPPAFVEATRSAIRLCKSVFGEGRRRTLWENIKRLRSLLGLSIEPSQSPIVPILVGGNHEVMELSKRLVELGFWVPGIRAPSVKPGTERLRVSLTSQHTAGNLDDFVRGLKSLGVRSQPEDQGP